MNLIWINDIKNLQDETEINAYKEYKELYDALNYIKTPIFRQLTFSTLNKASSEEKLIDAIGVTKWLLFLLNNDKMLNESMNSYFIDLLIASSLLHNLTYEYNSEDWTLMFKTRNIIEEVVKEQSFNIDENYLKSIYIPIESQLGKHMPNEQLIPNPNTPGAHVALACAIYYKKIKK